MTDVGEVSRTYVGSWFVYDVVANNPALYAVERGSKAWIVLSMTRVGRVLMAFRQKPLWRNLVGTSYLAIVRTVALLVAFGFVAHVLAMCFVMAARSDAVAEHLSSYVSALNFTIGIMLAATYVPFGTDRELIFSMSASCVGAIFAALLFGQVALVLANFMRADTRYMTKLEDAEEHMRALALPEDLRRRIRLYLEFLWHQNRCLDRDSFLSSLSLSLSTEVNLYTNQSFIVRAKIFKDVHTADLDPFLAKLVCTLKMRNYMPGDFIVIQGEYGDEMFFLYSGEAMVLLGKKRQIVHTFRTHDVFGESCLALRERRSATICASTYCIVGTLERDALNFLVEEFPKTGRVIKDRLTALAALYKERNKIILANERAAHGADGRDSADTFDTATSSPHGSPGPGTRKKLDLHPRDDLSPTGLAIDTSLQRARRPLGGSRGVEPDTPTSPNAYGRPFSRRSRGSDPAATNEMAAAAAATLWEANQH